MRGDWRGENFDLTAYERYHSGEMADSIPTDEDIAKSLARLPKV